MKELYEKLVKLYGEDKVKLESDSIYIENKRMSCGVSKYIDNPDYFDIDISEKIDYNREDHQLVNKENIDEKEVLEYIVGMFK